MYPPAPGFGSVIGVPVPPQVSAALEYLRFAECLRHPPPMFDGQRDSFGRELTPDEQKVYDSALEVLRTYFSGENDYAPGIPPPPNSGDEPRDPVPVR